MSMHDTWNRLVGRMSRAVPGLDFSGMSSVFREGDELLDRMKSTQQNFRNSLALNPANPDLDSIPSRGKFDDKAFLITMNMLKITEALRDSSVIDIDSLNQKNVFDCAYNDLTDQMEKLINAIEDVKSPKNGHLNFDHYASQVNSRVNDFFDVLDRYDQAQNDGLDSVVPKETRRHLYDAQSTEGEFRRAADELGTLRSRYKEGMQKSLADLNDSLANKGVCGELCLRV